MIKQAKDTPDGFLSHNLPFRKFNLGRFLDSLIYTSNSNSFLRSTEPSGSNGPFSPAASS